MSLYHAIFNVLGAMAVEVYKVEAVCLLVWSMLLLTAWTNTLTYSEVRTGGIGFDVWTIAG